MIQTILSGVAVVLGFGIVIFVHEMGHFLVAKKMNMKVDRFSFGLGPEMAGFQWGETRYCLAWIPLGGEVRLAGEMPGEETDPQLANDPRAFFVQPWYRRIPVVLAGPAMNYVWSALIFSFVIGVWGEPTVSHQPVIGNVISGMPAQMAGLQSDDRILDINGTALSSWDQAAEIIRQHPGQAMKVEVQRGTDKIPLDLTPQRDPSRDGVGVVGITPKTEFIRVPASQALYKGTQQTFYWSLFTLRYLKDKIVHHERPDISGPLGIAQVVAKAAHAGWQDLLFLIGMISVGVGLFNLFPIPLLDGGHLAFYLIEGIFGKPLKPRTIQLANTVGFSVIMAILLFATYNDIERLRASHAEAASNAAATKTP
jgi:regulator of sigma E protease